MKKNSLLFLSLLINLCCGEAPKHEKHSVSGEKKAGDANNTIRVGAEQTEKYLPLIKNKRIALAANHTSMIGSVHLADSMISMGVNIRVILAPEHGFRGTADAGEKVDDGIDRKTGVRIVSLYGKHQKPDKKDLHGIDLVIFDIQDVGARYYTYISTMHFIMEACAENAVPLLILDRPNPNGFYVDGPVLEKKYTSFSGMHPVPIVHGLTVAEYACMINGERWLKNGVQCKLTYITAEHYSHRDLYSLPVKPSPNLPDMTSVYLYPSLCLFEGTVVSVGRGTKRPFQIIGYPGFTNEDFSFTPVSIEGSAKNPLYEGKLCGGLDIIRDAELHKINIHRLQLSWLKTMYQNFPNKKKFFNDYFNHLAGNSTLKQQIINDVSENEIKQGWEPGIKKFKFIRKKYLLYEDFE